jgi:oligosaccharide translocation protein RFT1
MAAESSALAGATKAAAYGVALQAFIRVSSFTLNAFVLRRIQGDVLGVVNIRLTLLYNTLLFVSREALRRACLTRTKTSVVWSKTFNLMWCR